MKELNLNPLIFTERKLGNGIECKLEEFMFTITEAKMLKIYGDNTYIARFGWSERMEKHNDDYLCKSRTPLRNVEDAIAWCEKLRYGIITNLVGEEITLK